MENEPQDKDSSEPKKGKKSKKTEIKTATNNGEGSDTSTIEVNPQLNEVKGDTVVLGWGRMNPITTGHEKLANKIKSIASQKSATAKIYLGQSFDAKKNPLKYDDKIKLAQTAFGKDLVVKSKAKTIFQVMQELQKNFSNVILVVGGDRVKEFDTLLNKYNSKDYNFDSIEVVSAGDRTDPDSDDAKQMTADTMSASVMRKLASSDDFDKFKQGLPKKLHRSAKKVYNMVRSGMGMDTVKESVDIESKYGKGFVNSALQIKAQKKKVSELKTKLDAFGDKSSVGLTSNETKADPKWKAVKAELDAEFKKFQKMNSVMSKTFGKQMRDLRSSDRNAYQDLFIKEDADPCWDSHKKVGMKKKGNKMVPNCVPKEESGSDELDEIMNMQQRRKRALTMRKFKTKIAVGRKRSQRRMATPEKLKSRSRKKAIQIVRAKVAGEQGASYGSLPVGQKMIIDKKVAKRKAVVDRIAKRILPKIKKLDRSKFSSSDVPKVKIEQVEPVLKHDELKKKRFHMMFNKEGSIKLDQRFKWHKQKPHQFEEIDNDVDLLNLVEEIHQELEMFDKATIVASEATIRVRQSDVKPTAKIMATQHIEKGNFKKTLDILKFIGKKVSVDKSPEKTTKAIWTIEQKEKPALDGTDEIVRRYKKVTPNESTEVAQDPDVKDEPGTQPKKYYKGLSDKNKEARAKAFRQGTKADSNDASAYKDAPGDSEAKTKESEHTKKYKKLYDEGTNITEMKLPISDEMFKSLKKGDKIKINFDSSIKKGNENTYIVKSKSKSAKYNLEKIALKNVANPVAQASYLYNRQGKVTMAQGDMAVTMNSVVKEAVDEGTNMDRAKDQAARIRARVRKEIDGLKDRARSADASSKNRSTRPRPLKSEEVDLTEDSQAALQTKAEKSGISYSILKKVYDRGLAAWKTGHRPGATQQQWGYARVNSFITGGKTRTTADADLWKQHKGI
jgi:hypothetical protein